MLRNGFEETMRGDQVRLLDILQLDRRQVLFERLMTQVQHLIIRHEDIALEPLDAHAFDDFSILDGISVFAIRTVHSFLMDDFARARIQRVEKNAAVNK